MEGFTSTETLATAAGYVEREFGYGYRVRVVSAGFQNTLFELRAGDGSQRLFLADRYGNVELAPLELSEADRDERDRWSMNAADALYSKRNGYATALGWAAS